jgi:hypothetical protein
LSAVTGAAVCSSEVVLMRNDDCVPALL